MIENKSAKLLDNADRCADLATAATDQAKRKRYERMEKAWRSLAKTQAWLDGELPAEDSIEPTLRAAKKGGRD
jgi:hypothetical protein